MKKVKSKSKSQRVKYGFVMNFPNSPFTIRTLMDQGVRPKYITAYVRVKNALKKGILTVAGSNTRDSARRGAHEMVYKLVESANTPVADSIEISAPVETVLA